jgi:hypothetical protein
MAAHTWSIATTPSQQHGPWRTSAFASAATTTTLVSHVPFEPPLARNRWEMQMTSIWWIYLDRINSYSKCVIDDYLSARLVSTLYMIEPAVPVVAFPIALFFPQVQPQFPFRCAPRRRGFPCDCCARLALSPTCTLSKVSASFHTIYPPPGSEPGKVVHKS